MDHHQIQSGCDTHHLCWPRKKWNKGWLRELRNHWYFKIVIPKNGLHRIIHTEMQGIPVPDGAIAKKAVLRLWSMEQKKKIKESDSIEKRLRLLMSFFPKSATGAAFNRQLTITQQSLR